MSQKNGESIHIGVRIKIPHHEYLKRKAMKARRKNTTLIQHGVGSEINALIEADYESAKRKK